MKQGNFITKISSDIDGHDHEILVVGKKRITVSTLHRVTVIREPGS